LVACTKDALLTPYLAQKVLQNIYLFTCLRVKRGRACWLTIKLLTHRELIMNICLMRIEECLLFVWQDSLTLWARWWFYKLTWYCETRSWCVYWWPEKPIIIDYYLYSIYYMDVKKFKIWLASSHNIFAYCKAWIFSAHELFAFCRVKIFLWHGFFAKGQISCIIYMYMSRRSLLLGICI